MLKSCLHKHCWLILNRLHAPSQCSSRLKSVAAHHRGTISCAPAGCCKTAGLLS